MAELNVRLEVRLSRTAAHRLLAAALMVLSANELASESVTLTTYYPAPSGAYARLITTTDSYLARDSGAVAIGVGSTSAGVKLEVRSGSSPTDTGIVRSVITGDGTYANGADFYTNTSTRRGFVGWRGTNAAAPYNETGMYMINFDNSSLIFAANGAVRARIDSAGHFGVGAGANPATTSGPNLNITAAHSFRANVKMADGAGVMCSSLQYEYGTVSPCAAGNYATLSPGYMSEYTQIQSPIEDPMNLGPGQILGYFYCCPCGSSPCPSY